MDLETTNQRNKWTVIELSNIPTEITVLSLDVTLKPQHLDLCQVYRSSVCIPGTLREGLNESIINFLFTIERGFSVVELYID